MKERTLVTLFDASNAIRQRMFNAYINIDDSKSFKQFMRLNSSNELLKEYANRYIEKSAKDSGLIVEFVNVYIKGDDLIIIVKSNRKHIASELSFQCNTMLDFMEVY